MGEHIVSWFDLATCSKVIEDGTMRGYDFLSVLPVSLTVSSLQSILCPSNLAGRGLLTDTKHRAASLRQRGYLSFT